MKMLFIMKPKQNELTDENILHIGRMTDALSKQVVSILMSMAAKNTNKVVDRRLAKRSKELREEFDNIMSGSK